MGLREYHEKRNTMRKEDGISKGIKYIPVAEEMVELETRGVKIKEGDYGRNQWTEICRGCVTRRAKLEIRSNHPKECRSRILKEMEHIEDGRERRRKAEERLLKEVARRLEANNTNKAEEEQVEEEEEDEKSLRQRQ